MVGVESERFFFLIFLFLVFFFYVRVISFFGFFWLLRGSYTLRR